MLMMIHFVIFVEGVVSNGSLSCSVVTESRCLIDDNLGEMK